jgi:hypothetical protein
MEAAQTPWGQSMDPFAERDAFVNQLNQQRMQNQIAFNSGGMTDPTAGMTPGLNYQQAMQQAGLSGGAPSMSPNYGDSLIQRLNQSFGGQGDPFTFAQPQVTPYQPFVNQQGQQFQDTMSFAPGTSQAYQNQAYGNYANQQGYYQPQGAAPPQSSGLPSSAMQASQPSNYTPSKSELGQQFWSQHPEQLQEMQSQLPPGYTIKTIGAFPFVIGPNGQAVGGDSNGGQQVASAWADWNRRPGAQNAYSPVSTVGQPPQAPSGPENPYGAHVIDRPAPRPYTPPRTGIDANRLQFLQNKYAGKYENPAATYNDYVNTGLDNAVGQVLNQPAGYELYNQYQSADPAKQKAYGDRLKNLIYASASQQGIAPTDDWFSKKAGKSAADAKDQYFNEAMARYSAKQSPAGKAQSIPPQSKGMPYGPETTLPPGTTEADIWQRYKDRNAAAESTPQVRQPTFTNRPWQVRA